MFGKCDTLRNYCEKLRKVVTISRNNNLYHSGLQIDAFTIFVPIQNNRNFATTKYVGSVGRDRVVLGAFEKKCAKLTTGIRCAENHFRRLSNKLRAYNSFARIAVRKN